MATYIKPELTYNGRRCVNAGTTRTRNRFGYHNVVSVRYLDESGECVETAMVPAAKFNKGVKATGRNLYLDAGGYQVTV